MALVLASACGPADNGSSPSGSVPPSNAADLQLRPVIRVVPPSSSDWNKTPVTCATRGEALAACVAASLDAPRIVLRGPEGDPGRYVLGAVIVDGNDVDRAIAQADAQPGGDWIVYADLSEGGTAAFEAATEAAVGSAIAIIIEGRIVTAPVVAAAISSGDVVLARGLTEREATSLASRIDPDRA